MGSVVASQIESEARSQVLDTNQDPHDSVAYPSFSYPGTHPDRLATMAILHGLHPTPVERCRVLEIACNEGANLIPMAYAIPTSEFVGFDLARLPVGRGQERIRELGLRNLRIFQSNLLDVGADLGQFDYVIAHGFYAWVPQHVRDRMLKLCGELLTPNGIAFVSYNALPGGHLRTMLREMMLYRVQDMEDPLQRVLGGMDLVRFVAQVRPEGDAFRPLLEDQLKRMEQSSPNVICHDDMTAAYHPVHFFEFVEHAQKHGLQYLSEAVMPPPSDPCYRPEIRLAIEEAAGDDILRYEQMLDFVRLRMYRETLLCRAECVVERDFSMENLRRLQFASSVTSAAGEGAGARAFTLPGGIKMESIHTGVISLLEALEAAWPRTLRFDEIEPHLEENGIKLEGAGATFLVRLVVAKFIEFHTWRPALAGAVSERPRASASGRQEARSKTFATTLLHGKISLDDAVLRIFLNLLDGTRDRKALLDALKMEFPETPEADLEGGMEQSFRQLFRAGLLEA
jgi:methyltransferase-like protein/2-polyprenyl-3-methyl-5-hydroxy-6-metoxy-1,4-benzoquinol methylase